MSESRVVFDDDEDAKWMPIFESSWYSSAPSVCASSGSGAVCQVAVNPDTTVISIGADGVWRVGTIQQAVDIAADPRAARRAFRIAQGLDAAPSVTPEDSRAVAAALRRRG